MAVDRIQDTSFIDKVTKQVYKLIWMGDRMVLLESDNLVQILTTISVLNAYYEPLCPVTHF